MLNKQITRKSCLEWFLENLRGHYDSSDAEKIVIDIAYAHKVVFTLDPELNFKSVMVVQWVDHHNKVFHVSHILAEDNISLLYHASNLFLSYKGYKLSYYRRGVRRIYSYAQLRKFICNKKRINLI